MQLLKKVSNFSQTLRSAERGNKNSMYRLGKHYLYKSIKDQENDSDYEAYLCALYWLSKASKENVWEAYYWLTIAVYHFSVLSSGGPYHYSHKKEMLAHNKVYQNIVERLEKDGERDRDLFKDLSDYNTAYVYLFYTVAFDTSINSNCDDLISTYLYRAASHGCAEAQSMLGERYKICWDNWCNWLSGKSDEEVIKFLEDEYCTIEQVINNYKKARFWLLSAAISTNIDDENDDSILALLNSRHKLDNLVNRLNALELIESSAVPS